jgi:hypothetical protein
MNAVLQLQMLVHGGGDPCNSAISCESIASAHALEPRLIGEE